MLMQNNSRKYFFIFSIFFLFFQCSQEFEVEETLHPKVETYSPEEITEQRAVLNGEILYTGSEAITDHGFVYADLPRPSIENAETVSLGATDKAGKYQVPASRNMRKDNRYYVKAYAKTKSYLVYGNEISFISKGGSIMAIKRFFPAEGVAGDTVYLIGEGFSTVPAQSIVTFNGATAIVAKATPDTLTVTVPKEVKAGENKITLSSGTNFFSFEKKLNVKEFTFHRFSPSRLTFGDTLRLEGEDFSPNKEYIQVSLLGANAEIISNTRELIKVKIPDTLSSIISPVRLTIAGISKVREEALELIPPEIHSFSPATVTKDTRITVKGAYFGPLRKQNKAFINNIPLYILEYSPTELLFRVPSGIEPGNYPLVVEVMGQQVNSEDNIEVIVPEITDVTPQEGTWNDEVTIWGRNFGSGIGDNIVRFGEEEATVVDASSEKVVVKVPNKLDVKSSAVSIQVKAVDNLVATAEKTFLLRDPIISSFSPGEGKPGDIITINGQGFNPENNLVQFGQFTASVLSNAANQLKVQLPEVLVESEVEIAVSVGEVKGTSTNLFKLIAYWKKVADYPGSAKSEAVGFAIGSYGYLGLGNNDPIAFTRPFWKYNPAVGEWTQIAPFSFSGTASNILNTAAFVIAGKGYAGIGRTYNTTVNELAAYDPLINSWSSSNVAAYPGDVVHGAVSFSIGEHGYVVTGYGSSGKRSQQLWLYEPGTDSWQQKGDLPAEGRAESVGFAADNRAYIMGGITASACLSDLWMYSAVADSWERKADFPGKARRSAVAFMIQGMAYVVGGMDFDGNLLNDVWKYDTLSDAWIKIGDFPGTARANAVAFVIDGKAYIGTGAAKDGYDVKYLKDFWEFDPSKF
jgi:N-acetylneuraminic acid mutarotase